MSASKMFKKITRSYAAGEVIFLQGAVCDGIYSVQSGQVSVYKTRPTPAGPADVELVKLGPGSMFGEMGMLDQTHRDASVKALEFTEVIVITKDMFESQMAAMQPWVKNFIKIIIGRLRTTNERLTAAVQLMEAHGINAKGDKPAAPVAPAADRPPEDQQDSDAIVV